MRDGIVRIDELVNTTKEKGMTAVALTDRMNLFAAVKFYKAAKKAKIKPILGCDIVLRENAESPEVSSVFLCQNAMGYRHLTQLISRAYTENQDERLGAWVKYEWLKELSEGLIVLSGGLVGDIGQAILNNNLPLAREKALFWSRIFSDRFYVEIQRVGKSNEEEYLAQVAELAHDMQLPLIATNDVRFLETEDFDAHEARVCIHEGVQLAELSRRTQHYTEKQYLRSPREMQDCFEDYPEAIENALELTKRCNWYLELGKTHLPNFPVPEGISVDDYLAQEAKKGLEERLDLLVSPERSIYDKRITWEIEIIHRMGFSGYFLIVADFIQWAKNNDIPVGPGRGSGAGSLVAYSLKITDLDPIQHELLFERFLNPERVSMPDFDIDFCVDGRDRVIDYVAHKYGRDNVAQIITYGTMAAKAVIRDVGRVLGHPYGFVDKIAKLIPFEVGITLEKAMEQEEELRKRYEEEEDTKELLDLAKKLEGTTRNVGKHAGGVVIGSSALTDFAPLYCESNGENRVTQFDKNDVEAVGLVKFDFLGLKTLTIINGAVKNILKRTGEKIEIAHIPIDDVKTFDLLKTAQTTALFQLESRGMRELVHRLQLDCFDDIMALVALYRPGPLDSGMDNDFVERKKGRTPVVYPHPDLEGILKPTYGVILYQEQVMQIAQVLAGYTLGAADILRSAMGKKKVEEMAKQRKIFVDGSVARGVDATLAASIFDLMEKFAGYGFNKSHSAAYALVSYQTAWLKAHYPSEFMAAVLSGDMGNTDKIKDFMEECHAMKLTVKPPNVNESEYAFTVNTAGEILYGLGAIKGMGQSAIELLLEEKQKNGHYKSLFDLCKRVDLRKISRKVLEALIGSGACDGWELNRGILFGNMEKAIKSAEKEHHNKAQGQHDLFSLFNHNEIEKDTYDFAHPWHIKKQLHVEKEKLGFYLSGHPYEAYKEEFRHFLTADLVSLNPQKSNKATVGGLVVAVRKIITKRGKKMAIVTLEDNTARLEIAVFQELLEETEIPLVTDEILIIQGEIAIDEYSNGIRMRAEQIFNIPRAREIYGEYLLLTIDGNEVNDENLATCHTLMKQYATGDMFVRIHYKGKNANAVMSISNEYSLEPDDTFIESLNQLKGISATVVYVKQ